MIDSQLFGMKAGRHLLVNALIHVANTLLVFWFLLRATHARWPSALVAALFALHPLHVESVAWASERKDTLSTFFGLLSLIAYTRYVETRSRKWYAGSAVALGLGLLAKPMLVTWPFVMLLLDYWPFRRLADPMTKQLPRGASYREAATGIGSLALEKLPLFALVAASAVITFVAQSHGGAVRTLAHAPIAFRLSNALVAYAKYLLLTFWPNDLAVYYPFRGHTSLADHRRSISADWNYGVLCFSTENSALPHGWLALVSGNTGSGYRNRSGWRANHGGPLLLYSVNRFVHCAGVRISGHRQELACCAIAQRRSSCRGSTDSCYAYERADSALA